MLNCFPTPLSNAQKQPFGSALIGVSTISKTLNFHPEQIRYGSPILLPQFQ